MSQKLLRIIIEILNKLLRKQKFFVIYLTFLLYIICTGFLLQLNIIYVLDFKYLHVIIPVNIRNKKNILDENCTACRI